MDPRGHAEPTHINLPGVMLEKMTELHFLNCRWVGKTVPGAQLRTNPSGNQSWRNVKRAMTALVVVSEWLD